MNQVSFSNMDEIGKQNQSIDSFKEGGEIKHISGKVGGYLVGKRHSEGGIKAINKSTGQPLEMEGGEVVITRNMFYFPTLFKRVNWFIWCAYFIHI